MANYSELLDQINDAIYENNDQEIDALEVRAILREMVTSLGSGFLFKGIATPSSPSGTGTYEPDQNVFYLATTAGTYTYLGGLVVPDKSFCILKYDGSWALETISAEDIATFLRVDESGFHLVDDGFNIALKYDDDGLDAAKVSDHFVELLKQSGIAGDSPALSCFAFTNEPGFAIVDQLLNIGVKVDQRGIHSQSILEFAIVNS